MQNWLNNRKISFAPSIVLSSLVYKGVKYLRISCGYIKCMCSGQGVSVEHIDNTNDV